MIFPKEYFYDEVREGFYISGMMKRSWAAQIQVLDEVDRECKKFGVKWFADCGTLLGAVRHGGFVPWDDDLDICMLRDDYQKFHKYVVPNLPKEYEVMTYECGEYWQMITRVVNRGGISFRDEDLERFHGFPYACGIDVFVLDYLAPDPGEEEVRRKLVNTILSIGSFPGIDGDDPPQEGLELIRMAEETCKVKLDRKNNLRKQLYALAEQLSCLYPSKGAKEVVLMPFWCSAHDHKYSIKDMENLTVIPFECGMINVPAGYDNALKVEYGDYLKIHKGGGLHNYPLYQAQEDYLAENWRIDNPYRYIFKKEDLDKVKAEKPAGLKQRAIEYCGLLKQIHGFICSSAEINTNQVLDLLEQSQDGIIHIGEEIEAQEGEGGVTVSCIERYCEALYVAAQQISTGTDIEMTALNDALFEMENSIRDDLKDKKEILFIVYRSELWSVFEPLYRAAAADKDVLVTVMPVPFYDKNAAGKIGDMHYDTEGYPEDIKLTDHNSYDVGVHHPDIIYTMYAYDAYNYTYTLPPAYYTSELKKHTDALIYIPYFRLGKIDAADQKLRQTCVYFVKIPGLMHADKVLLESEEVRKMYFEELKDFCGEDTADIWEEKLKVMDEQIINILPDIAIPEAWERMLTNADGEKKKTILFMNAVCSLFQYKEQAIKKIKDVLKTFEDNKEKILLIWRPHPSIALSAELFERDLWLEYRQIIEEYRAAGWGILDESRDAQAAIELADAYYGDPDPIMQKCRVAGKPVMIADCSVDC